MKSVFFYGLFMDPELLEGKGLSPSNPVPARIKGYGIRIGERASLVESENETVYGIVMSLDDEELKSLYREEGVSDYVPEILTATTLSNEQIEVTTYNLPPSKMKGRNKEYARSLAVLAGKLGFPTEYVEELKRLSS